MENTPQKSRKIAGQRGILIFLTILGISAALAAIIYGLLQLERREVATNNPSPTISEEVVTESTQTPDETVPTKACANYSVPSTQPKRLNLPTLGVEGCIERVGIDQDGAIAVPTNIHVAGWYVDSVLPGEPGLSIIDGHINGNFTNDGIFQHLDRLKENDEISVTRGDGKELKYRTSTVKSIPLDEASDVLFTRDKAIISQLNLVTCGGKWNEDIKQFDRRIIVVAELVQ